MDMSSTIIQTFLCIMEAFMRVSWFIVKVPFYVHATVPKKERRMRMSLCGPIRFPLLPLPLKEG